MTTKLAWKGGTTLIGYQVNFSGLIHLYCSFGKAGISLQTVMAIWILFVLFFRFLSMDNRDVDVFFDECQGLLSWIENTYKLITENKPHPIDEDALDEYIEKLTVISERIVSPWGVNFHIRGYRMCHFWGSFLGRKYMLGYIFLYYPNGGYSSCRAYQNQILHCSK